MGLTRWGFRVDLVETNRLLRKGSLLSQLLRLLMLMKGRKASAAQPSVSRVRSALLSDAVLFGEALIVGATKSMDCR